jgi:hypothetical protein
MLPPSNLLAIPLAQVGNPWHLGVSRGGLEASSAGCAKLAPQDLNASSKILATLLAEPEICGMVIHSGPDPVGT